MAKPYNPLAPLTPKQLHQMALKYTRAQFGPVLSQINAGYARRARSGAASIAQGTSALASSLAPQAAQTHQSYGEAQAAQSAIDNAISSKLAAAGQTAQADVGGQLAAAGQAPSTTNLAQVGAGAGAASFGMGSAALSRLVAEGAARENYSASLPGLARMGGAYRQQDLSLQLEHGRQDEVQALQAKMPGTIAQIEQGLQQNEFNKAAASLSYTGDVNKLNETSAYHAARVDQSALNAGETARHNRAMEDAKATANQIAKYKATHPASSKSGLAQKSIISTRGSMFTTARGYSKSKTPPPYKGAFRRLFLTYNMPLRILGLKQPQIEAMIAQALSATGYSKSGKKQGGGGGYQAPGG